MVPLWLPVPFPAHCLLLVQSRLHTRVLLCRCRAAFTHSEIPATDVMDCFRALHYGRALGSCAHAVSCLLILRQHVGFASDVDLVLVILGLCSTWLPCNLSRGFGWLPASHWQLGLVGAWLTVFKMGSPFLGPTDDCKTASNAPAAGHAQPTCGPDVGRSSGLPQGCPLCCGVVSINVSPAWRTACYAACVCADHLVCCRCAA